MQISRKLIVAFSLFHCIVPTTVRAVGFDGIPGDYCRIRQPVQCCTSRDDDCTAPILGNHLCYCDIFCREHPGNDCCPDFADVCEHKEFDATECVDDEGKQYSPGIPFKRNCHTCTCDRSGRRRCDDAACIIQEDLLDKVQRGDYSWKPDNYSDFWGKLLDDGIRYRLGTLYPERSVQNMNEILIEMDPSLPENFDAREKWPDYIHPVRNQMNCGSSWAFSTTAVSADRLAIQSKGKVNVVLAPQLLISCNQRRQKEEQNFPLKFAKESAVAMSASVQKTSLTRTVVFFLLVQHQLKKEVVSEQCYPYQSGRTNEPGPCLLPQAQYKEGGTVMCPSGQEDNRVYKMTPPYRISSKEEEIMTEIYINGPVQATFLVHEDFYMYRSGVYQHLDLARHKGPGFRKSGYHSVRIIGWGVDRTSDGRQVKYWLCDNSWGEDWGDKGYFKILRGENHCEVESFVLAAWGKGSKRRRLLRRKLRLAKRSLTRVQ
uniref:SMB domain-containing protein n=1 Tax=Romanomermis culicivorax TaxID=13658 RepID=A0A915L839_ROMCU